MYVYAIRAGNHLKIGVTRDIKKRLSGLQTASAVKLQLTGLWTFDNMAQAHAVERSLHSLFADKCTHGEWFEGVETPEIEAAIPHFADHRPSKATLGQRNYLNERSLAVRGAARNVNATKNQLEQKLRRDGLTKIEAQSLMSMCRGYERRRVFRPNGDGLYREI